MFKKSEGNTILIIFSFHIDYDYSQFSSVHYDASKVKYEEEGEEKFNPDVSNGTRQYPAEYEEGEY